MEPSELKQRLTAIETDLDRLPVVKLGTFDTPTGSITVALTDRLRKRCRKGRVWKSSAMLTALKNVRYGFDPQRARSRGGADGIFLLDRDFRPANAMMRKIFDRFLDRPDPLVAVLAEWLSVRADALVPVRVVSHHLRLLGVLAQRADGQGLALVDYDDSDGA